MTADTPPDGSPAVLVVGNDLALRLSLVAALTRQSFEVGTAAEGASGVQWLHETRCDICSSASGGRATWTSTITCGRSCNGCGASWRTIPASRAVIVTAGSRAIASARRRLTAEREIR